MLRSLKHLLLIALLFLSSGITYAEESEDLDLNVSFPLPYGNVRISNAYEGHVGRIKYSLDMQYKATANKCELYGQPILSVRKGTVSAIANEGEDGQYGTYVTIKHESDDSSSHYAHMIQDSLQVTVNDRVEQGQILGLMGDTGRTSIGICEWTGENAKGVIEPKTLEGIHLHFEMRNKKGKILAVNSLVGQETYKDIKVGNNYLSDSKMYDPNNYWNRVKYRYQYVLPDEGYTEKPPSARIIGFTPLSVKIGERPKFTITGAYLPKELYVNLPGCDPEWDEQSQEKHTFTCNEFEEGVVNGVVKFSEEDEGD
jgi:hypothetical protein